MFTVTAILIKAMFYASALLTVGLAIHAALGFFQRRVILGVTAVIFILLALLRLVQLNAQAGGGWTNALQAETFTWIWMANATQFYAFVIGAMCVGVGACLKTFTPRRLCLSVGALVIAVGFGLSGHTQSLETSEIAPIVTMVHVLIAGFWVAAPVILFPKTSIDTRLLVQRVKGFSRVAIGVIPILFVTGMWLLWKISGSVSAIFTEPYGRILFVKLIIASLILLIGAFNKLRVTTQLETAPEHGRSLLAKTLTAEAALFFVVIILVAIVTTTIGPSH